MPLTAGSSDELALARLLNRNQPSSFVRGLTLTDEADGDDTTLALDRFMKVYFSASSDGEESDPDNNIHGTDSDDDLNLLVKRRRSLNKQQPTRPW